jgi:DNA-binding MarR family transcriptional regulator
MLTCSQRLSLMSEPANPQMRIAPGAQLVPTEQLRSWLSHAGAMPDLTHTAGHVLAFLAAHFAKDGSASVSEESIAGHVRAEKSTVVRSVRHLTELGLLAVMPGAGHRPARYLPALPKAVALKLAPQSLSAA